MLVSGIQQKQLKHLQEAHLCFFERYVQKDKHFFGCQMISCGCSGCVQVGAGECSNLVPATHAGGPVFQGYFDIKQENA